MLACSLLATQGVLSVKEGRFGRLKLRNDAPRTVHFAPKFERKMKNETDERWLNDLVDPEIENLDSSMMSEEEGTSDGVAAPIPVQFSRPSYDFMVPEGSNENSTVLAVLSFFGGNCTEGAEFSLVDEGLNWLQIGHVSSMLVHGSPHSEVAVNLRAGADVRASKAANQTYAFTLRGSRCSETAETRVRVDILSFDNSEESRREKTEKTTAEEEPAQEIAADTKEAIVGGTLTQTTQENTAAHTQNTTIATETTTAVIIKEDTSERKKDSVREEAVEVETEETISAEQMDASQELLALNSDVEDLFRNSTTEDNEAETETASAVILSNPARTAGNSTEIDVVSEKIEKVEEGEEEVEGKVTETTTEESLSTSIQHEATEETTVEITTTELSNDIGLKITTEGLDEMGSLVVRKEAAKGEMVRGVAIVILKNGRPDGSLISLSIDRSDIFTIRPKKIEQGGKAYLFVREPRLLRATRKLSITVTAEAGETSVMVSLPVSLQSDSPPSSPLVFSVEENASHGQILGVLSSSEGESDIGRVQGFHSIPFALNGSVLSVDCGARSSCLDYESTRNYEFFIQFVTNSSSMSKPILVIIRVMDVNDNVPRVSVSDDVIRISGNRLTVPLAISMTDSDSVAEQSNAVVVSGSASSFLALRHLEGDVYEVALTASPSTGNYSLTIQAVDRDDPEAAASTKTIQVKVQKAKAHFRKPFYERILSADKLVKGKVIGQVELEGIPIDEVFFIALRGNPGWVAVEDYGGRLSVGTLPRDGVEAGDFTVSVAAVERKTGEVVAEVEMRVNLLGGRPAKKLAPFARDVYSFNMPREGKEKLIRVELAVRGKDVRSSLVESTILAFDSDGVSSPFKSDWIHIDGNRVSVEREAVTLLRVMHFEIEAEGARASVVIFFSSEAVAVERKRKEEGRPFFPHPWTAEDNIEVVHVREETAVGTPIAALPATNPSTGDNVHIHLEGDMAHKFAVDQSTGSIVVAGRLDYEDLRDSERSFFMDVYAGEKGFEAHAIVHVKIDDCDDNPPVFAPSSKNVTVSLWENSEGKTRVASLRVGDADEMSSEGKARQHLKFILLGPHSELFGVESEEKEGGAVVSLSEDAEVDREELGDSVQLRLLVADPAGHTDIANLLIHIMDRNDNAPVLCAVSPLEVQAMEGWPAGVVLAKLAARDADQGENARMTYRLSQPFPYVSLDEKSGELRLTRDLLGMARPQPYQLLLVAEDHGPPSKSASLPIHIVILEPPYIHSSQPRITNIPLDFELHLQDRTPASAQFMMAKTSQKSMGAEKVRFDLQPATASDAGWVDVDTESGALFLLKDLNATQQEDISVMVMLSSAASPPSSSSSALLRLRVDKLRSSQQTVKQSRNVVFPIEKASDGEKLLGRLSVAEKQQSGLFYHRIPSCSNSTLVRVDERTGEVLFSGDIASAPTDDFCVLVSEDHSVEVSSVLADDSSVLHFSLLPPASPQSSPFHRSSFATILFDKKSLSPMRLALPIGDGTKYQLLSARFTPCPLTGVSESKSSSPLEGLADLFSIDAITGEVMADSQLRERQDGVYSLLIGAFKENKRIAEYSTEVHVIPEKAKLRLVFSLEVDELGRNVASFSRKLNEAVEGDASVYFDRPHSYSGRSNRSSVCVHVLGSHGHLLPVHQSIRILSLPSDGESPLAKLYHSYHVINLEHCSSGEESASTASSTASASSSLSNSEVLLFSAAASLVLVLFSLLLYLCFFLRFKNSLRQKEKEMEAELSMPPKVNPFDSPSQFITLVPPPLPLPPPAFPY